MFRLIHFLMVCPTFGSDGKTDSTSNIKKALFQGPSAEDETGVVEKLTAVDGSIKVIRFVFLTFACSFCCVRSNFLTLYRLLWQVDLPITSAPDSTLAPPTVLPGKNIPKLVLYFILMKFCVLVPVAKSKVKTTQQAINTM